MTAIIDLPDCVVLFPEVIDERLEFFVMQVRDGQAASTDRDPCEFLHYRGFDYGEVILAAEALAKAHGVAVFDRVVVGPYEVSHDVTR